MFSKTFENFLILRKIQWDIVINVRMSLFKIPVMLVEFEPFKACWLRDATTSLTFNNCTLCPHCIYVFCIYLRTNSDLCHLQHKQECFITEIKSVYSAVRTGSLNKAVCASSLKGQTCSHFHDRFSKNTWISNLMKILLLGTEFSDADGQSNMTKIIAF